MKRSPVLLIIFNRPDTTQKVFEAIRNSKPHKLYVASDGPRPNVQDDFEKIEQARKIATQVDWDCELHTKFENNNLGCGPGPASAMSWIFKHEDRAIILEDDCVPAQSFFPYCDELLEKYKDDERVWTISGNNYYEEIELPYSYIFSNYGHSQGWATWRRCWQHFDIEMNHLEEFLYLGGFNNVYFSKKEADYFNKIYFGHLNNDNHISHAWDTQFNFIIKSNGTLSIVPTRNLVKNIGILGTHSSTEGKFHNRSIDDNFKIVSHPKFVIPYNKYDFYSFMKHYGEAKRFHKRVFRKILKFINVFKNK